MTTRFDASLRRLDGLSLKVQDRMATVPFHVESAVDLMTAAGLDPDPWQRDVLASEKDRVLMLCARQSGKSTVTAVMALFEAMFYSQSLVLLLSPSLRQSGELFRKVVDIYLDLGQPIPARRASALRLELANGSRIESLPGKERTVRGYSNVSLLVIDEAAVVEDDLFFSVSPMLAVSGGRLIALSTPRGRRGWFYEAWTAGGDIWQRVKSTIYDNQRVTPEFIEEERRTLPPLVFQAEYECKFTDNVNQLFSSEDIEAAFDNDYEPLFENLFFSA